MKMKHGMVLMVADILKQTAVEALWYLNIVIKVYDIVNNNKQKILVGISNNGKFLICTEIRNFNT